MSKYDYIDGIDFSNVDDPRLLLELELVHQLRRIADCLDDSFVEVSIRDDRYERI